MKSKAHSTELLPGTNENLSMIGSAHPKPLIPYVTARHVTAGIGGEARCESPSSSLTTHPCCHVSCGDARGEEKMGEVISSQFKHTFCGKKMLQQFCQESFSPASLIASLNEAARYSARLGSDLYVVPVGSDL